MAKKERSIDKKHYVKDPKVKGFGMEIPNRPVKPKESDSKPKKDEK